jgi:hypothetical protein
MIREQEQVFIKSMEKARISFRKGQNWAYGIIYTHRFAKVFWGEGQEYYTKELKGFIPDNLRGMLDWQYYLQKMVLEENPMRYLERFL